MPILLTVQNFRRRVLMRSDQQRLRLSTGSWSTERPTEIDREQLVRLLVLVSVGHSRPFFHHREFGTWLKKMAQGVSEERRWLYSGVMKMWREFKLLYIADQTFGMKTIISHLMGVGEWGEMAIRLQFPPLFIKLFATYFPFLHSSATFCANTIKCNATRSGAVATVTAIA